MTTVLIIEDEKELSNVLKAYLERGGYDVLVANRGDQGLALWESNHPDMVLLDLNLPGMDGIDIARKIRQTDDTPLIMTTARVEELDRLLGLEMGADDYITKPFSPREVVARVKAVLRRVQKPVAEPVGALQINDLEIDPQEFTVTQAGVVLELTPTEFSIWRPWRNIPGGSSPACSYWRPVRAWLMRVMSAALTRISRTCAASWAMTARTPNILKRFLARGIASRKR